MEGIICPLGSRVRSTCILAAFFLWDWPLFGTTQLSLNSPRLWYGKAKEVHLRRGIGSPENAFWRLHSRNIMSEGHLLLQGIKPS
ncbi:hypothetical protein FB567DRAFT_520887 [Paraphoma chrysanthemicola]|uniref:Uncharacterized protein n=1 Tax=Paraphoma chrysanthemicola TaxID=798071 RepID=A0A8K0R8X3_9PLEO|nr:hypothetical protein FB567DRAFT_520887 [Paraphoma chrysanthemicola]